jgi:hypothetical protein
MVRSSLLTCPKLDRNLCFLQQEQVQPRQEEEN